MNSFWRAVILQICYFQNGNYLTLKKIILESSSATLPNKLPESTYFDIIRLLDILGIVEISEVSGQIRWSCNLRRDQLNAYSSFLAPKTGNISFHFAFAEIDFDLKSIESISNSFSIEDFRTSIVSSLPDYNRVLEKCTSNRNWSEYLGETEIEYFDFEKCKWHSLPTYLVTKSCLIKRKLDSGATEFLLVFPQKNEARKIIYGEWAYALALGSERRNLFTFIQNGKLKLQAPIRLPSVMNRLLLSYATEVSLDFGIRFKLESEDVLNSLNNWLGIKNVSM